jgi:hypothetical protein
VECGERAEVRNERQDKGQGRWKRKEERNLDTEVIDTSSSPNSKVLIIWKRFLFVTSEIDRADLSQLDHWDPADWRGEGNGVSEYGKGEVRKEGDADRKCLNDCGVGMVKKHWWVRIAHSSDHSNSMRIVLDDEKEEERRGGI